MDFEDMGGMTFNRAYIGPGEDNGERAISKYSKGRFYNHFKLE